MRPAAHRRRHGHDCRPRGRRPRLRGARLLQDRRIPARLDPRRHPGDPGTGHGQRLHRHRHRGRRRLHHGQPRAVRGGGLPHHHRRRAQRQPSRRRSSPTSAAGGGYVGVHSAADTEYDWPFYGGLVGAYFASHPPIQQATVRVEDRAHAATAHLGPTWARTDEWYNYRTNPRADRARPGHRSTRLVLRRRRWAPTTRRLVQDVPGRPVLVHRRRPHRGSPTPNPAFRRAPARRHPLRGGS